MPPARFAFTSREGVRIVEPGALELWVGASCADRETETVVTLTGDIHPVPFGEPLWTVTSVS